MQTAFFLCIPLRKKVPLGVTTNDREQANYPIYNVLGTKTNTRVTQISQSYNIFTIVCGFKHIHTHDLNTALVFFTLQRWFKQAHEYLTTDGEAHIKFHPVQNCLCIDSAHKKSHKSLTFVQYVQTHKSSTHDDGNTETSLHSWSHAQTQH